MFFKERAEMAMKLLAKQPPVTLEQARAQAQRVRERMEASITKRKGPISANPQMDENTSSGTTRD